MKIILNDTTLTKNKLELTSTYGLPSEIKLKIIKCVLDGYEEVCEECTQLIDWGDMT